MNSEMTLSSIFEDNFAIYNQIELETPEPKWELVFFKRLPESHIIDFIKMIQKPKYENFPYFNFLKGIINEYGIKCKPNIDIAIINYKKGAEANDSYCLLKLYFIIRNHASMFNFEKSRDLEMLYLIKSAAYFDYYSDERYKFYPVYQLAVHLDKEDNNVEKCHQLLRKFEKIEIQKLVSNYNLYGSETLEKDKKKKMVEYEFLHAWLSIRFYLSKEDQKAAYRKIRKLSIEEKYIEACFLLSELYVGHIEGGDEYDLSKAEKNLKFCIENNLLKAYTSLASLYEKMNDYNQAIEYYFKAAKRGCYRGLYEYASFIICGYMTPTNFRKGIKYFIKGFWLGYMYSADHLVLILNNSEYQKKNNFTPHDYKMCFEISLHLFKNYEFISSSFLKYGPQYYLVSICYEKGLNFDAPNLDKALEVLLEGEKDIDMKEKKYVLYRLGRIYHKKHNMNLAKKYFEDAYSKYIEIIYDDKLTKYPAQYYRVGKLLENGWGVEKNINLAVDYYKKGTKPSKYFFLLQYYYQNKCKEKYQKLKQNIILKNFVLEKHSKQIHELIVINNSKIATASEDSNIFLWDLNKKTIVRSIFKAHKGAIHHLCYTENGNLISLGADYYLKIWSLCNCKLLYSFDLRSAMISMVDAVLPSLGGGFKNKIMIQINTKIQIFDIYKKKFNEEFSLVNAITSMLLLPNENLWFGGDVLGVLTCMKFDKNLKIAMSTKNVFHHKQISNIVKFKKFEKNFLITSSYDGKICIILYSVGENEIKLLLERRFTMKSNLDLKGLAYSPSFKSFFIGNCVGKIIIFDKIFIGYQANGSSKNEKKALSHNNINEPLIEEKYVLDGHKYEIEKIAVVNEKFLVSISASKENFIRVWSLEFLNDGKNNEKFCSF